MEKGNNGKVNGVKGLVTEKGMKKGWRDGVYNK